jgi:L-malate glycosyltransferase
MYIIFIIKRYLEQILMSPFVLAGKIYANNHPLLAEYDIFFFFPSYSIGGGERVQGDILNAVSDKKVLVFFTKISTNSGSLHLHALPNVTIIDIGVHTDNKYKYWMNFFYRGVCAQYINNQKNKTQVFIAQSNFGYKTLPHIKRNIPISEIIHMHVPKFLWVWAPFIKFIHNRILLGPRILEKFKNVYKANNIPERYLANISLIPNCLVYIPPTYSKKDATKPLNIYYAGRGSEQKRVWLIVKIIEICRKENLDVHFFLAGSFKDELPMDLIKDGTYIGEIAAGDAMNALHYKMDMLLMTSAWEGFPMAIMEAMSFGNVCNVCAVDEIPSYIFHEKNGLLIHQCDDENAVILQAVANIKLMIYNPDLKLQISQNAYNSVINNFTVEKFNKSYRRIFNF